MCVTLGWAEGGGEGTVWVTSRTNLLVQYHTDRVQLRGTLFGTSQGSRRCPGPLWVSNAFL